MTTFKELGILPNILNTIEKMGFTTPTPIQEQAIPVALEGKDILGSAETGSGKTAAFMLPILCHLTEKKDSSALILLPTRELAVQVLDAAKAMTGKDKSFKTALLIGGDSVFKQLADLRQNPKIIIGTPGRVNDHLNRKSLKLNKTDFFVLDETDRMLDMGFGKELENVLNLLPEQRQTLLFSATMPKNIVSLSQKYLNQPVRITIGHINKVSKNIKQEIIKTNENDKYEALVNRIGAHSGSTLIFVKTKFGAERLAKKLCDDNLTSRAIHGDLKQVKRQAVIKGFRSQNFNILVATDIAARGLDISHIEHVVNYDLPQCPEDYIHRIGRTGRAGTTGVAINLITQKDNTKWGLIKALINDESNDGYTPTQTNKKKNSRPEKNRNSNKRVKRTNNFEKKTRDESFSNERPSRKPRTRDESFGERSSRKPRTRDESFGERSSRKPRTRDESFGSEKPFRKPRTRDESFGERSSSKFKNKDSSKKKTSFGEKKSFKKKDRFSDKPLKNSKKTLNKRKK